jgi:hypothetical protein
MSHHGKHQHSPARAEVAQQEHLETLAYRLWEEAGRPQGQAARFWKDAEEQTERLHPLAEASVP